jgi:predicted MFS family arabinose efflux permease
VSVQTWILQAAPTATEAATGLNTCAFNLAIALGALSASVVAGSVAISAVLWLTAALVGATSLAVWRTPEHRSMRDAQTGRPLVDQPDDSAGRDLDTSAPTEGLAA